MINEADHERRKAEFYSSKGVKDFLIPHLESTRSDLVEHWVATGEESDRFRIKEIDDLLGEIERFAES